jgi:hypothetical protein
VANTMLYINVARMARRRSLLLDIPPYVIQCTTRGLDYFSSGEDSAGEGSSNQHILR